MLLNRCSDPASQLKVSFGRSWTYFFLFSNSLSPTAETVKLHSQEIPDHHAAIRIPEIIRYRSSFCTLDEQARGEFQSFYTGPAMLAGMASRLFFL
jgi:hypothetical protein